VLVVGLAHGSDPPPAQQIKDALYARTGAFVERFREVNGALRCRDLVGLEVNTPAGLKEYRARNLMEERCSSIVANAVRLILHSLDEWQQIDS
jgi:hypothetical protein